jgi:O-antigen ligase
VRAAVREGAVRVARDPFRAALFALLVLTISRIHQQISFLQTLRPALVLTGLAVIIAYAKPGLLSKERVLATWPAKLIAMFAGLACLSAPFGISLGHAAVFILNDYLKTIVLAFLIIVAIRGPRDFYGLVWAIVISTALLLYTTLFVFKVKHYGGYDRLEGGDMYDANDLGLVMLVGMAFTLLAFQGAGAKGKAFCAVVLAGIGASISKSGSRGALIGLVALVLALVVLIDGVSLARRLAFVAVTGVALAFFSPPGYWLQMKTILAPQADYNWNAVNGRREVAARGVEYFKEYPVFGLGINNFSTAECTISDKAVHHSANTALRCTPPHNAYIEAMSELGIGGIALWLLMIPGAVVSLLQARSMLPRAWAKGDPQQRFLYVAPQYLAVGFVGFSVGAFFLSFAWTDVTYILVSSWAALMISLRAAGGFKPRVTASPRAIPKYRASVLRPESAGRPRVAPGAS